MASSEDKAKDIDPPIEPDDARTLPFADSSGRISPANPSRGTGPANDGSENGDLATMRPGDSPSGSQSSPSRGSASIDSDGMFGAQELAKELSRYRIDRLVGIGGFARVYIGYDTQLLRNIAIKVANRGFSTDEQKEEFLHEARTVASLDHPHILPIYDVGYTDSGFGYVVTKFVSGGDLAGYLRTGKLSRVDYVRMIASVAEALHHAHKRGIVHRDVKPANILIDEDFRAFLSDFGIALTDPV